MDTRHPEILKEMAEKKDIKGELTDKIKAALEELAGVFQAEPVETAAEPAEKATKPVEKAT